MRFDQHGRPGALRPLPGPAADRGVLLAVPFADYLTGVMAVRTVELAKRAWAVRIWLAVCGACASCAGYSQILRAVAGLNEIEVTAVQPAPTGHDTPVTPGLADVDGVEWFGGSYAEAVWHSKRRGAAAEDAVDGNPPGPAGNHGRYTHAVQLVDRLSVLPASPARIWMPYDPDTFAAVDAALALLGWPTTLIGAATGQVLAPAAGPPLGARAAGTRVEPVQPGAAAAAAHMCSQAGIATRDASGLAALLAAPEPSDTGSDLVLIRQQHAPLPTAPEPQP